MLIVAPMCSPGSLEEKPTASAARGWPCASVTDAVAVLVELPLAKIEDGDSVTTTWAAEPAVWVRDALPDAEPSVAVIVAVLTAVVLVIVAT